MKLYNPFSGDASYVVQATVSWAVLLFALYGLAELVMYSPVLIAGIIAGTIAASLISRVLYYIFKGK